MSAINDALHQVGVDLTVDAASNLIGAIGDYNKQYIITLLRSYSEQIKYYRRTHK